MIHPRPGKIPRLQALPKYQVDALVRWLVDDKLTYATARAKLRSEYSVTTTESGLSKFWHDVCVPRMSARSLAEQDRPGSEGRLLVEVQIRLLPDSTISVRVNGAEAAALSVPNIMMQTPAGESQHA